MKAARLTSLPSKQTPLHLSACFGHVDVCKFLVTVKADVRAEDARWFLLCDDAVVNAW